MQGVYPRAAEKERFESKFRVTPGCWIWEAGKGATGYGRFRKENYGKTVMAHRFSYELYVGPIPEGFVILHACDNPACVNPSHLSVGTHYDNVVDRMNKDRSFKPKGELHPHATLTEAQVIAIRSDRRKQCLIAADYGIRPNHVSQIKTGKLWPHIGGPINRRYKERRDANTTRQRSGA